MPLTKSLPLLMAAALATSACGDDGGDLGPAPFPDDYATSYTPFLECVQSTEHDQKFVRIFASPDAADAYGTRTSSIPVGAILVKEQFRDSDDTCSTLVDYSVMVRVAAEMEITVDWDFLAVSRERRVVRSNTDRCVDCHIECGLPEGGGFEGTCAALF